MRVRLVGLSWFLVLSAAAGLALGCSSDAKSCGTSASPDVLTLSNVQPALGSTVPNAAIVQSFTVVGRHLQFAPSFALAAQHTAGIPNPNPVHWTLAVSGEDIVYTSEPITWATAPGHVELNPPGLLNDTTTGCVLTLPSPTFSYDVGVP